MVPFPGDPPQGILGAECSGRSAPRVPVLRARPGAPAVPAAANRSLAQGSLHRADARNAASAIAARNGCRLGPSLRG